MSVVASTGMSSPKRITLSVKVSEETAVKLRQHVRYNAGHPNFFTIGAFVEQAILNHIAATEDPPEATQNGRRTALTTDLINHRRTPCR